MTKLSERPVHAGDLTSCRLNALFKGLLDGADATDAAKWLREAHVDPLLLIGAGGSSGPSWKAPTELRWGEANAGPLFSRLPFDKISLLLDELSMRDKLALTQVSVSMHSLRTTDEFWRVRELCWRTPKLCDRSVRRSAAYL